MRAKGLPIKRSWFVITARNIYSELYPNIEPDNRFKFSRGWFNRFKYRRRISLRAITNQAQEIPENHRALIELFHDFIRRHAANEAQTLEDESVQFTPITKDRYRDIGRFSLANIANMDQTPLQFEFISGKTKTYEMTGAKTVWSRSKGSGLDKRQATVQLCIFADGVPRIKPLIVFKGQGTRLLPAEKNKYDKRVSVVFQENAWVDEVVTKHWLVNLWKPAAFDPINGFRNNKESRLLVFDAHRAQKTEAIRNLLHDLQTIAAIVPPGCTSLVQPLDVSINKPFKDYVAEASHRHFEENIDQWETEKFTAGQRRVLMTTWVGEAWERMCKSTDTIKRSFQKCGITVAIDGATYIYHGYHYEK
ncbi:hypothetical protein ABW20_dc0105467 [Dactylellina cionopaga]|nr:hypothetical protein ABW20_dc0105467 [Dactylellina cionopaga]